MTPSAVLVLVAGVLLVLVIAGVALLLDARRRAAPARRLHRRGRWPRRSTAGGSTAPGPSTPRRRATPSSRSTPPAAPSPPSADDVQTGPIGTADAREDPPTIAAPRPPVERSRRRDDPPGPRSGGPSVRAFLPDEVRNRPTALPVPVVQAVFHPRPHHR